MREPLQTHDLDAGRRTRRADTMLIATNLVLVVLVLLPAYLVIAALLEVVLGSTGPGGTGAQSFVDSVRHHAKDRWWVPLLYLFVAPFASALLVWLSHRRTAVPLRIVAVVVAPAGFLALFVFLFGQSAAVGPLVRAAMPGVLATLVYASVIRLPSPEPIPSPVDAGGPPTHRHLTL